MSTKKELKKSTKTITDTLNKCTTISGKIRYLNSLNWSQGDIHRFLTKHLGRLVRPQHVNNVLKVPVKTPVDKF